MTQKDLIQKLKLELGKDFNENASFLVTQPLFKDMTVGLKKDELVNGIYVTLLDKNQAPMLDGNAFYFKVTDPEKYCKILYDDRWKKYMFPLSCIGDWSTVICGGISYTKAKNEDLVDKPTVFPVPKEVLQYPLTPEECYPLGTDPIVEETVELHRRWGEKEPEVVEEFPIQKIHTQTVYTKEGVTLVLTRDLPNHEVKFVMDVKTLNFSEGNFSDLVDLMIEARKDLLK